MTTVRTEAPTAGPSIDVRTARATGLLYLAMGVAGMAGFLVVQPLLFEPDAPAETLTNLLEHEQLARLGIALELSLVIVQTLTALWFYRLFRPVDAFAAGTIAVFGLVNAVAILGSAAFLASALHVAVESVGDPAATAQLMYVVSDNLWGVGAIFFGMWLLPMGWCVLRSGWMPRPLGWLLVAGGAGYLLSAFGSYLLPEAGAATGALTVPATVAEFWMIGHLLLAGVHRRSRRV